jgi:TRAP-type C4-dicarboxylate transport system permease large subunit
MAILPWLIPLLGSLIVLTYVPQVGLFLPRLMGL